MIPLKKRYLIGGEIEQGSFGIMYNGVDISNGEKIAIKAEKKDLSRSLLLNECKIMRKLNNALGFPAVHWFGEDSGQLFLVMDLYGESLEQIKRRIGNFSLKTTLMISYKMLCRIEFLHRMGYIHCDIKPANFLMGQPGSRNENNLFLIDFGLSRSYIDFKTMNHIIYQESSNLSGTPRFSSLNVQTGIQPSRRDDLISMCYTIIYLFKGTLPWQGLKKVCLESDSNENGISSQDKEKNELNIIRYIIEKKIKTKISDLCSSLPSQFELFCSHIMGLQFTDEPDYQYLRELIKECMLENGFVFDDCYEWVNK